MTGLTVRLAGDADLPKLLALFTESVHQLASRSYSAQQLHGWAPVEPDVGAWTKRVSGLTTYVAERSGSLAGFLSLRPPGHIEMLFTIPVHSRTGVASALYRHALRSSIGTHRPVTADASHEARPFFEKMGWTVIEAELVERAGVHLERFRMQLS